MCCNTRRCVVAFEGALCSRGRLFALFLLDVVRVDVSRRRAALRPSRRGFRGRKIACFVVLLRGVRYAVVINVLIILPAMTSAGVSSS